MALAVRPKRPPIRLAFTALYTAAAGIVCLLIWLNVQRITPGMVLLACCAAGIGLLEYLSQRAAGRNVDRTTPEE